MFLVYNWKVKCLLLLHFVEDNICAHLIFLKVVWNNFVQIEHRTPDYFSSWHLCTNLCFSSLKYIYSLTVFNMEKAVATHSITLAWKIPWAEEPGRLQSMGSHRVGHDWSDLAAAAAKAAAATVHSVLLLLFFFFFSVSCLHVISCVFVLFLFLW